MTKIIETSVADHIIVGRVEPFIYAFSTKDAPKALKVGDTYRPVAKRLEEWRDKFSDLKKSMNIQPNWMMIESLEILLCTHTCKTKKKGCV